MQKVRNPPSFQQWTEPLRDGRLALYYTIRLCLVNSHPKPHHASSSFHWLLHYLLLIHKGRLLEQILDFTLELSGWLFLSPLLTTLTNDKEMQMTQSLKHHRHHGSECLGKVVKNRLFKMPSDWTTFYSFLGNVLSQASEEKQ